MKFGIALAAALFCTASLTHAGGMSEPMMEPVVVETQSGSSGGFVIPLLLLAVIAAIASSSDSAPTPSLGR